jgi:type II secretory pathway component GspD/PulD (secretin)
MLFTKLKATVMAIVVATFVGIGVRLVSLPVALAQDRRSAPEGARSGTAAQDSKPVTRSYPLKHAIAARVVELLESLFIVVNEEEAYVRFHPDGTTNSLLVRASRQHQGQIAQVFVLIDAPDRQTVQPVQREEQKQLVKGYRLKHTGGEAAVDLLRSLFLVVNHRVAYARFAYDPRTHLVIAIASNQHQTQIAEVLDWLETQATPTKGGSKEGTADQVRVVPIRHIDGDRLISRLRSRFVIVNHEQASVRFGFDPRTHALVIIAPEKLQRALREIIADLDQRTEGRGP